MYDIIIYPELSRFENASDVIIKAQDGSTIYCVAYAEVRNSTKFNLTYGRYTITCVPWNDHSTYKWFITSATGGLEVVKTSDKEYISTLLATSSDSSKLIYKVQTYTGSSHPSVNNPDQTLFVKPQ